MQRDCLLLQIDPYRLPADAAAAIPYPALGADPTDANLTPAAAYVLSRIDGMSSIASLFKLVPLPPEEVIEALHFLARQELISFDAEFETRYLAGGGPAADGAGKTVPPQAPPRPSLPTPPPRASAPPPAAPPAAAEVRSSPSVAPAGAPGAAPAAGGRTVAPLAIDRSGDLGIRPPAKLFRDLKASRYVGTMLLRRRNVEKRIHFFAGEPVQIESTAPEEEIGTLMFKKGKLDEEGYASYQTIRRMGKSAIDALIELGAVMPGDAAKADRWRAQAVLFDALMWREGNYEIGQPGQFPEGVARYDLTLMNLMLKAWREAPFDDTRRKFLDAHRNWYVVPGRITDDVVSKMRLNPKEQRLLEALRDTARRIRDIFDISSLMFSETYRFIDGLLAMGLAEISEHNPTEAGPVDPKEIKQHLMTIEAGNLFERLGTHPVSIDADIDEAYRRIRPLYDPARYRNLKPQTREMLEKILAMLDEAYEQLRVQERRKEYRAARYDRDRLEYFSEIQYKKGEVYLLWRQDSKTALTIFESCHEMCPDNALYAVSYALASVRAFPGERKRQVEAGALVDQLLSRPAVQPKVIVMAAGVVRALGDIPRSEQLCRQAIKAAPESAEIAKMVEQVRSTEGM